MLTKTGGRNPAIDAYRGFVMLLMMAEVLELARVSAAYPSSVFWRIAAFHQTHAEWVGCSLHDLIQPSFSFLVGVALPWSIASRVAKGQTFPAMLGHALRRSLILVALGIFLRSLGGWRPNFTFEDTLTQIGLGYTFLFLLGFRSERAQWGAFAAILFGYWLAWALYPAGGIGAGVPPDWSHNFKGFAAHWNKNANLGQAFDLWFLNLFPRPRPFLFNAGGYLTLSFIPTLGTMILGLIAGGWVRRGVNLSRFLVAGAAGLCIGVALHTAGICLIVKRIWTPSWTLFSGGACFLLLTAFTWVIEVKGRRTWAMLLVAIGSNSMAAYLMAHLLEKPLYLALRWVSPVFALGGAGMEPFCRGLVVLACYCGILWFLFRRRVFLRI